VDGFSRGRSPDNYFLLSFRIEGRSRGYCSQRVGTSRFQANERLFGKVLHGRHTVIKLILGDTGITGYIHSSDGGSENALIGVHAAFGQKAFQTGSVDPLHVTVINSSEKPV